MEAFSFLSICIELRRDLIFSPCIFCMPGINVTLTFDFGISLRLDELVVFEEFVFGLELGLDMIELDLHLIDELGVCHCLKNV